MVQQPIYFISRVLQAAEKNSFELEKPALSLVATMRRLRPYFEAHPIIVLTNSQLKQVMGKPSSCGRLVRWTIELGEFYISYEPRTSVKGQVLADFLAEFTRTPESARILETRHEELTPNSWQLYVDGAARKAGCGAGLILTSPSEEQFTYALRFKFPATNNEAEYEVLYVGLRLAKEMKAKELTICLDSQLIAKQVTEEFEVRDEIMRRYLQMTTRLLKHFDKVEFRRVPRLLGKALPYLCFADLIIKSITVPINAVTHCLN